MNAVFEVVWMTCKGTVLMIGAFMFFIACIYVGLFVNAAFWSWLASLI